MLRFIIFTLILCFIVAPAQAEPLPYEYFGNLPDTANVRLSPDGKKTAAFVRIDSGDTKGMGVQVSDISSGESDVVLFTDNTKYYLASLLWKDARTLIVKTYYPDERDTWMGGGQLRTKTREFRAMFVDTKTGDITTPFKRVFLKRFNVLPPDLANFVDLLPDDPDHVLMALPSYSGGPANVVHKVNIHNQDITVVQNSENGVLGWATDQQHHIRLGKHWDDGVFSTLVRDVEEDSWRTLWPYESYSKEEVIPIGFGKNPNTLYLLAYHQGRKALFKVNLKDPELTRELVYSHPTYDVGGYLVYDSSGQAMGISSGEEGGIQFFDAKYQTLGPSLSNALPADHNVIYNMTPDRQHFLVYSSGSTESGTYYHGQTNPIKLNAIAYRYQKLPPEVLATTEPYPYKARDGLDIEGWLTVPRDTKPTDLPTIVFPHGGPQSRDSGTFDYWAQFFANRGYAVLRMNFRGSEGLGFEHRQAGLAGWGKDMQNDIQDGALSLIEKGIANPDKVCIAGASYGGYAALMGVVKTPDFYQCAISFAGVSDVVELVREHRSFTSGHNVVDKQVGKIGEGLKEASPINFASKVRVPVLLVHGNMDRQVDVEHSRAMHAALKDAGKNVTYIELEGEDHHLSAEHHRLTMFKAMDEFLAENMPVEKTP